MRWSVMLVLLLALVAAQAGEKNDPRLVDLSNRLTALLVNGKIALTMDADARAALANPAYGAVADYRAWIGNVRDYSAKVAAFQSYADVPKVAELAGDPVNVPWRLDRWARGLTAPVRAPGNAGLEQAAAAWVTITGKMAKPAKASSGTMTLERMTQGLAKTAQRIDTQALESVSADERALLRSVITWICRSGEPFYAKSKGSPYYGMEMQFAPNSEIAAAQLTAGALRLTSVTGLARYLHALAGQPVTDPTPFLNEKGEHPQFTCHADAAAMAQAYAEVRALLAPARLAALRQSLLHLEAQGLKINLMHQGVTGQIVAIAETPYGPVIVGGSGANSYTDVDALAIFDLGGDDTYVYTKSEAQIGVRGLQVIVDYTGDDVYQTRGVGGPGAGLLGIGVLIDLAGNDRYCQGLSPLFQPRAQTRATLVQPDPEGVQTNLVPFPVLYGNPQKPEEKGVMLDAGFAFGAGFLGIGVLVDATGDDLYLGQKFAFGCGYWRGAGVLHDDAGNDVYASGLASIGAGINGAMGLLDDRAGDDHYQCLGTFESAYSAGQEWDNGYMSSGIGFGSSWRAEMRGENPTRKPTLGGGIGLVHDAAGNDSYIGSSFGVAASYAGGVGAIIDEMGNDTYFVKRGPNGDNRSGWSGNHALGNGCHRGVGYLLDRAGNDRYSASGLGGGTAWDIASGFLLDLGGDDAMTDLHGKGLRGNTGWGAAKGFAVSYHVGGKDTYERGTFGDAASIGDGYPGVGGNFSFFFDIGPETDDYPKPFANDCDVPGSVTTTKEQDGKAYPQGIGVFVDGK